jgi:hypothetical protein
VFQKRELFRLMGKCSSVVFERNRVISSAHSRGILCTRWLGASWMLMDIFNFLFVKVLHEFRSAHSGGFSCKVSGCSIFVTRTSDRPQLSFLQACATLLFTDYSQNYKARSIDKFG